MLIRPEMPADHAVVRAVVAAAFDRPDEADLVEQLRTDGDVVIALVAEMDGRIVGHVMLSRLQAPVPALGLAPVSVAPEVQGRGVGSALVRAAVDGARAEGFAAIFVLGDPGYYDRFGFSVETARPFASPYAGEHFAILALDPRAAGVSGQVDYPVAFAALD